MVGKVVTRRLALYVDPLRHTTPARICRRVETRPPLGRTWAGGFLVKVDSVFFSNNFLFQEGSKEMLSPFVSSREIRSCHVNLPLWNKRLRT